MRGYKAINEFSLDDCKAFIRENPGSQLISQVRAQFDKIKAENEHEFLIQKQRLRQEAEELAKKETIRRKRNIVLMVFFIMLLLLAGIFIYFTYAY